MRSKSFVGRVLSAICNERKIAPPAPAIPLAKLKPLAMAAIEKAAKEYPGPWQTRADGRRYRVRSLRWDDEQGVMADLEWEDQRTTESGAGEAAGAEGSAG